MMAPTHTVFATLSIGLFGAVINTPLSPIAYSFAALGSVLPDIDTTGSGIGKMFLPLSTFLERKYAHRTITHSLLGALIFAFIFSPMLLFHGSSFYNCLVFGILNHIVLDAANKTGVPLFYPHLIRAVIPNNERFRILTGSREEYIFLAVIVGITIFVIPLNRIGMRGALHYLIRTPQSAVADYLSFSSQDYSVFVDFEGVFNVSQKRISGYWEALGSTSRNSLIIKDNEGRIYSIGSNPNDNIRSLRIQSRKGKKLKVSMQEINLQNQLLSDILKFIPEKGETYLLGHIKTYDKFNLQYSLDEFSVCKAGVNRIDFLYATSKDIANQNLSNLLVIEGQILIRTISQDKETISIPQAKPVLSKTPYQVITFYIKDIYSLEELKIKAGEIIQRGDLLASLSSKRDYLLLAKQRAEQQLKIAQQELDKIKIESTQEMRLKEEENRLSGRQRDLSSVTELNRLKLSEAEAKLNLALLSVKRLEQKLMATQIHSPVDGKVISIQVQHATVTLRILTQDSISAMETELPYTDPSESIEDDRE